MKDYNDKFTIETVYSINCFELEKIIQEIFNLDEYSIVCAIESSNDVYYKMSVEPFKQDKEELNDENTHPSTFLDEMCFRGLIIPGDYLIEVSW